MTRDEMRVLIRRRVESWGHLDVDALMADYAEDAVLDSPYAGNARGRDAIRDAQLSYMEAFGDIRFDQESLLIDGEQAALLFKFTGTHIGKLLGVDGTGKRIAFRGVMFYTVKDGRIVYERRLYDFTGFLVKIGLLKARPV